MFRKRWRRPLAALAACVGVALAACGGTASPTTVNHAPERHAARTTSNVAFEDYAGSKSCAGCHADVAEKFFRAPMHTMTRDADTATSHAPWNGGAFTFKNDKITLSTSGGARFATLESGGTPPRFFRVTKIIGGNYREDFAAWPVDRPTANAKRLVDSSEEVVLPVSWLIDATAFRVKGYSVMVKERPGLREGPAWNRTCIFCHNTPPFLSTMLGALTGPKGNTYQGEVVDPLLPPERRVSFRPTDEAKLFRELANEATRIGGQPPPRGSDAAVRHTIETTRRDFGASDLVEIGIGCESCHYGSRAHAEHPTAVKPTYWPKSEGFVATAPPNYAGKAAYEKTRACARCHQVLFSGYEPTWEGGSRHGRPGGSHVNSGEARDFLLGACTTEMTCTTCHDPHGKNRDALGRLEGVPGNATCTTCHAKLASREALAAHSHHSPDGAGSACMDCHMPRKNMTLDSKLGRYHRVGSPTEPARVLLDRPIECALCHQDKTVESLVATMERWWSKRYDRAALAKLYGSLDVEPLRATLRIGKPHEQAVAYATLGRALGEAPVKDAPDVTAELIKGLSHPIPLLRGYAKRALEDARKKPFNVDTNGSPEEVGGAARAWLR